MEYEELSVYIVNFLFAKARNSYYDIPKV